MIQYEQQYLDFISARGVGLNDRVASSPKSYVSYLRSVSKLLAKDITPSLLRSEQDIGNVRNIIEGQRAPNTIRNYCSAMRQYIAFVLENKL
jgi:hypothetical protein